MRGAVRHRTIFKNFDAGRATFASDWQTDPVVANMSATPLFELARVFVRLDHVACRIR
jgi:hypothetical protein